ncbi:MAG: hypothetical protein EAZ30_17210 [Betaproteobacteria bacterium]|nr:MAG: hypothetical protein EAZ30_17210 [Betaproteobacteria bacterium]
MTLEARISALATAIGTDIKALQAAGAVGDAAVASAVLNVPTLAPGYAEVVVTNAAVTPASKIMPLLVGELDAENDLEELADSGMRVFAVPEAGQIHFVLTGNGPFTGDFKVNYQLAN